jgi:hypothetical protein
LSDEPTRVRISYTVKLHEVPERISNLLDEAGDSLAGSSAPLYETAKSLYESGNTTGALDAIEELRGQLMDVDLRLADCMSLLINYQSTQAEIAAASVRPEEPQEDVE